MLIPFAYPVDSAPVRAGFRARLASPFSKGVDFEVPYGSAVRASQSGRVVYAGAGFHDPGSRLPWDAAVIIEHAPGFQSCYGRLSEVLTQPGRDVQQGEIVGRAGTTGLNWAVLLGDLFVDPTAAASLGVDSTAAGVVAGGHRPGGTVNLYTLRHEAAVYGVLGLLMLLGYNLSRGLR